MQRNVTIRTDEELLRRLRHRAVDRRMSLSAWISATLEGEVSEDGESEKARERALRRLEHGFHLGGRPLARDELHAR